MQDRIGENAVTSVDPTSANLTMIAGSGIFEAMGKKMPPINYFEDVFIAECLSYDVRFY